MTVEKVVEYLQMDEHAVYELSCSRKIPAFKIAELPKPQLKLCQYYQTNNFYTHFEGACLYHQFAKIHRPCLFDFQY